LKETRKKTRRKEGVPVTKEKKIGGKKGNSTVSAKAEYKGIVNFFAGKESFRRGKSQKKVGGKGGWGSKALSKLKKEGASEEGKGRKYQYHPKEKRVGP